MSNQPDFEPDTDQDAALAGLDEGDLENQIPKEDSLLDRGVDDLLDEGYSPPERYRSLEDRDETIEDRIRQEEPDPNTAYGAPVNESGLDAQPVGGDDPDAIPAEDDFLGDEVGGGRSGRLVAPDEGLSADTDSEALARDVGINGAGASAEEAAVHIMHEDDFDSDPDA